MFKKVFTTLIALLFITNLTGCLPERKVIIREMPENLKTMEGRIDYAGKEFFQDCTDQGGTKAKCIDYAKKQTKDAIDQSGIKNVFYEDCIKTGEKEITCKAKSNIEMEKTHKMITEQIGKF